MPDKIFYQIGSIVRWEKQPERLYRIARTTLGIYYLVEIDTNMRTIKGTSISASIFNIYPA